MFCRSKDLYLKEFPTEVLIRHVHNHPLLAADTLRHRPVNKNVEDEFKKFFSKGHSPSSALEIYKAGLQEKYLDDYYMIVSDGSICPSRKWCYDLYYKIFKKEYGNPSGKEIITSLHEFIDSYNTSVNDRCATISTDNDNIIVAICTPLMKRVHSSLKSSSELVFIDSSGHMDRHNSRVFLVLCASVAGALPLGIFLTYSETEAVITQGLHLLNSILPSNSFYNQTFPRVVITDDSTSERNSLKTVYPRSHLLLCQFHVLQAFMRYVWCSKSGVNLTDRVYIYKLFSKLLYTREIETFHISYDNILKDKICVKYDKVISYLSNFKVRAKEWACCYRQELLTRGNNTNNFCEAAFRILKDKILNRTKAFSIVQLFDFLTSKYESYYKRKIIDVINNRYEGYTRSRFFMPTSKLSGLICEKLSHDFYKVVGSNKTQYFVNTSIEMCTCFAGFQGSICKHQVIVFQQFGLTSQNLMPISSSTKNILHKVATGEDCSIKNWYLNLHSRDINIQANTDQQSAILENITFDTENSTIDHGSEINNISSPEFGEGSKISVNQENRVLELHLKIDKMASSLKTHLSQNPDIFTKPLNEFIRSNERLKTETSVVSALHTFGKYNGAAAALSSRKKSLKGGSNIGVQPTALARRKSSVGGRRCAQTGRPPKNLNDHSYCARKRANDFDLPCLKKVKQPHSLQFHVQ